MVRWGLDGTGGWTSKNARAKGCWFRALNTNAPLPTFQTAAASLRGIAHAKVEEWERLSPVFPDLSSSASWAIYADRKPTEEALGCRRNSREHAFCLVLFCQGKVTPEERAQFRYHAWWVSEPKFYKNVGDKVHSLGLVRSWSELNSFYFCRRAIAYACGRSFRSTNFAYRQQVDEYGHGCCARS